MNTAETFTEVNTLRFVGDWLWWIGLPLALVLGGVAFWLYRRELRERTDSLRWWLPTLRALAVFLIVMILTGPVLHHTRMIPQLSRLLIFVDASHSMGFTDVSLEPHRKLLAAEELGFLPAGLYDPSLRRALDAVEQANAIAISARRGMNKEQITGILTNATAAIQRASDEFARMKPETWPGYGAQRAKIQNELIAPGLQLAGREASYAERRLIELNNFANAAVRWRREIGLALNGYIRRLAGGDDAAVKAGLLKYDQLTRWQRAETLLLTNKLLARLVEKNEVVVRAFGDGEAVDLWRGSSRDAKVPAQFSLSATNASTDLGSSIAQSVAAFPPSDKVAVILLSDGQHNSGPSPVQTARVLGNRTVPIYSVGLGSQTPPPDLAVVTVNGPESVFIEDRVRGEVILKDDLPTGKDFTLRIAADGKTVWSKNLAAEQRHRRSIAFDFPVKEIKLPISTDRDVKLNSLPMRLDVSATPATPDQFTNNNVGAFHFRIVSQRPKVLLVDGRPRWEFRYVRNLFERDSKWEVNTLLGGDARPWPRGKGEGKFPANREELFDYHLIILGDISPAYFKPDELVMLKEFVEKRGGGIIFIDGRQEQLSTYKTSVLAPLFPVGWEGSAFEGSDLKVSLSARGNANTALTLANSPDENDSVWARLLPPRWSAPTVALPSGEVLLSVTQGKRTAPMLAFQRYGAGRVLYAGFDESWRWRYEYADRYHTKYWNQLARWIMDAPYAVSDKYVSLDAGASRYAEGESAELRVKIRDAEGKFTSKAKAEAHLYRGGVKLRSVSLEGEDEGSGVYRGKTGPLKPGEYEVRVHVEGLPETEMKAVTSFVVQSANANELIELSCDEDLLRQLAAQSGGEYFREEETSRVVEKLTPLTRAKVIESETVLWQSWWWFGAVVVLLTIEWAIRKRVGLL